MFYFAIYKGLDVKICTIYAFIGGLKCSLWSFKVDAGAESLSYHIVMRICSSGDCENDTQQM